MKNGVDVRVNFSFKGENFSPSMTVDLDAVMNASGILPDFYSLLARQNKIDTYSYLYEVMESSEIRYENATGLAAECVVDGEFDLVRFQSKWHTQTNISALQEIVKKYQLEGKQAVMDALQAAYELGKADR